MARPKPIVFSSLFPSSVRPQAGLFIRERMFRVGARLPLVVVSPQPWFPLQGLIRRWRPHYRPLPGHFEEQDGFAVHYPRFLAVPGLLRRFDGWSMALCCLPLMRRLRRSGHNLIDAHFAYPDGYAATLLGRWLELPVTITLRGTELPQSRRPALRRRILAALAGAARVFAVAAALRRQVVDLGADSAKILVVGNGVDTERFKPMDRQLARQRLNLPATGKVLITVGGLVERKGIHRVIELLPRLVASFPDLIYLVIGGGGPEGDIGERLKTQALTLGLADRVRFLGAMPAASLALPLSAADVFVLATANEGWANVFLEAMACGLPVVTTDVGGNREVVVGDHLGSIVPFGDSNALLSALTDALRRSWDRTAIRDHALAHRWEARVEQLCGVFEDLIAPRPEA